MRTVLVAVAITLALAGCGAQSHVAQLKPLTRAEASKLLKSVSPGCDTPGRVSIRYVSPVVHGKGGDAWWCVAPAQSYRVIRRDVHCPTGMHVTVDLRRHLARCESSN
jgi:hypothetical protein